MKKIILSVLVVILLSLSFLVVNGLYFKPVFIDVFYARIFLKQAFKQPEILSSLGILEQFGLDFHNDDLSDVSEAQTTQSIAELKSELSVLRSYDRDSLPEDQRLSYDILEYFMDLQNQGNQYRYHDYPVNQLFGVQSQTPTFMLTIHRIEDFNGAENYVKRLAKFEVKFAQVIESLKIREENGILPPRFVIERVIDEITGFVGKDVKEHELYTHLKDKLAALESASDDEVQTLLSQAEQVISEVVYPTYNDLLEYLKGAKARAGTDDGVWRLPNGDDYYQYRIKFFTTTDFTPEEIHQLGLSEVARIQQEMREALTAQGYSDEQSVGQLMQLLNEDPRFLYPDTDQGREQILNDYQTIIDEFNARQSEMFNTLPKALVEVKRIPEFKEKTSPGAYYNAPARDGSRPGIFYANLYDIKATPKYGMRTLAYHEAIPGHHFQIAIQSELQDVPFFRTILPFTAFAEGWALYAEQLAYEYDFHPDPFSNLGRLQAELFRAVRLVVDSGLHYKRWSREKAIDYMIANTGMAASDVTSEIERYIVLPGQALAYKVGMLKILELRERAQQVLGTQFDIREFHDAVLTNGSLPLAILEQVVNQYIKKKQQTS